MTEEAELEEEREAMVKYGSSYVQTNEESSEQLQQDWNYGENHSIDSVGLDNIDEFHAKLKQHPFGAQPAKKWDFESPILKEKVMDIITELETLIQKNMEQRLNDEVESNVAAS